MVSTVNCVAPGWVETEMTTDALADAAQHESIIKGIPLGRVATPEDIAGADRVFVQRVGKPHHG